MENVKGCRSNIVAIESLSSCVQDVSKGREREIWMTSMWPPAWIMLFMVLLHVRVGLSLCVIPNWTSRALEVRRRLLPPFKGKVDRLTCTYLPHGQALRIPYCWVNLLKSTDVTSYIGWTIVVGRTRNQVPGMSPIWAAIPVLGKLYLIVSVESGEGSLIRVF